MDINKKLLIQGKISDGEIESLKKELNQQDFEISKYTALAHGEHELLNLIFHDFNVISFTRDFFLSALLTSAWTKINEVIKLLSKSNKKVDGVSVKLDIKKSNGDMLFIHYSGTPDKFELLISQSDSTIDLKVIDSPDTAKNIYIALDSNNNIKITKI